MLETPAAQQTEELLSEAPPADAVESEVDGRVDDDAQFGYGERLVDDVLVKLHKSNDTVKLHHTNDCVRVRHRHSLFKPRHNN